MFSSLLILKATGTSMFSLGIMSFGSAEGALVTVGSRAVMPVSAVFLGET